MSFEFQIKINLSIEVHYSKYMHVCISVFISSYAVFLFKMHFSQKEDILVYAIIPSPLVPPDAIRKLPLHIPWCTWLMLFWSGVGRLGGGGMITFLELALMRAMVLV